MKDLGLDKGLIQSRDTSDRKQRGWGKGFFGFRKMFWDYLTKLGVPFVDPCCDEASTENVYPVRYNGDDGTIEYWDGSIWTVVPDGPLNPTTTTTTTSTTTTTTTP